MKKTWIALLLALFLPLTALGAEGTLPEPETRPETMILGESSAETLWEVTLYHAASDGLSLSPTSRMLLVETGDSPVEAAIAALLDPSGNPSQLSIAPGETRLMDFEVTGSFVTINLSIDAANVQSDPELLLLYTAIANTLTSMPGIEAVNVLINDRHLPIRRLPAGVMRQSPASITASWAQFQADSDRFLSGGALAGSLTRELAVYFPSIDGDYLLPELRTVEFSDTNYARTLLTAIRLGPTSGGKAAVPSSEGDWLLEEPSVEVTTAGEKVLTLNFRQAALAEIEASGIPLWQVLGAVTVTMCSFLPELDGIRVLSEGSALKQLDLDGPIVQLSNGLMTRRLFSSYVGATAELYLPREDGALEKREVAFATAAALSPRALLERVLELAEIPDKLSPNDLLGVRVDNSVATVNLSSNFYSACQSLGDAGERAVVYAIVNTLCELQGVRGARLLIEGREVETLSQKIYLRTVLFPNPGIVLTE